MRYLWLFALLLTAAAARDLSAVNPPFPRIANCYGNGLRWQSWDKGGEHWSKVDLFLGGCYDLHYDWDNPRWERTWANVEANVAKLHEVNPNVLVLPYVDVVEGPYNPALPDDWWDLRNGQRWSGWPGYDRINTKLPAVLQYNLEQVRDRVLGRDYFDGVFYDCWAPDDFLCPETAKLRDGQAIVMVNCWNLPTTGFSDLNGCLAEDETSRVMDGRVDFEDFLERYFRWCRESRKPAVTTLVCAPEGLDGSVWGFRELPQEERLKQVEEARLKDQQSMRFGLTTTLLEDGYFSYDAANMGRGKWWWYPEYDAPLGYPKGRATKREDGLWQREYDGGLVLVNGTAYDVAVELPRRYRDVSTGRVGTGFMIPVFDGKILIPTDEPASAEPVEQPRLTAAPPKQTQVVALPNGLVFRTPGGLDLRFDPEGRPLQYLLRGELLLNGGFPVVAAPPFQQFLCDTAPVGQPTRQADGTLTASWRQQFHHGEQRAEVLQTLTVGPGETFSLKYDATATSALDIRMWRNYLSFPRARYAGSQATSGGQTITLPAKLGDDHLLPSSTTLRIEGTHPAMTVGSTLPLGLIDHRKYGQDEYLLAGYPVSGKVEQGKTWSVTLTVTVD